MRSGTGFSISEVSTALLDRHAQRRAQSTPTVTTLIGAPSRALACWNAWALAHEGRGVVAAGPTAAAALTAVVASPVADLLRERVVERAAASRARSPIEWWCAYQGKGATERAELLAHTEDALLRRGDDRTRKLWFLLPFTEASATSPIQVLDACAHVLAPAPLALAFVGSEAPRPYAEMACAIVEAIPQACVALVLSSDDEFASLTRIPRITAILREGALRVTSRIDGQPADGQVAGQDASSAHRSNPADDLARSEAERSLHRALQRNSRTSGLFALNVRLPVFFGNRPAEIDLLATSLKIAIEIDGYHHFSELDGYRRDRRKDLLLQQEGYLVVRVLAIDVMDHLGEVVTRVCEAVERRRVDMNSTNGGERR